MKKIILITLILTMLLSMTACKKKQTISPEYVSLYYSNQLIEKVDGTNDVQCSISVSDGYEGKGEDIYHIYYSNGDEYQDYGSTYKLDELKQGIALYVNCMLDLNALTNISVIISQYEISELTDVSQIATEIAIDYCKIVYGFSLEEYEEARLNDQVARETVISLPYESEPKNPIRIQRLTDSEMDSAIKSCAFPEGLGGRTLSTAEIRDLVGKDPDLIAEKIKTVADAFAYVKTVSLNYMGNVYSENIFTQGEEWTVDHYGKVEIVDNGINCCGGMANLLTYLLYGDYDEIEIIRWIGGGNHTINYILAGGKYYTADFTEFCNNGKWQPYRKSRIAEFNSFDEYYSKWLKTYGPDYEDGDILSMLYFACDERGGFPSSWDEHLGKISFPIEKRDDVHLLYSKTLEPEKVIGFKNLGIDIPGWNSDFSGYVYHGGGNKTPVKKADGIPEITWEETDTFGYNTHYTVKLADTNKYTCDDLCSFTLSYMANDVKVASIVCTFRQLKDGYDFVADKSVKQRAAQAGGFTGFELNY